MGFEWEMENYHHWEYRLFSLGPFLKLQIFEDLDQDVLLHLLLKNLSEGMHRSHEKKKIV